MTTINTETGEIVETLTEAEAQRLTNQVRLLLSSMLDQRDKVVGLIREARARHAYTAMGYPSWTAYVADEFADAIPRLSRDEQIALTVELAEMGMSTRAIAPVVGLSRATVARDIHNSGVSHETPPKVAAGTQEEVDGSADSRFNSEATSSTRAPVTGLDGKVYKMPERPRLASVPAESAPVLDGAAAEFANAEKASKSLSNAIAKLLEFQHPNMREAMSRYWSMASSEVPPTPRRDVTPEQMRVAAQGLLALADEWSTK